MGIVHSEPATGSPEQVCAPASTAPISNWRTSVRLTLAILKSGVRDIRSLAVSIGVPLMLMVLFWIIGSARYGSGFVDAVFPGLVCLGVMNAGQAHVVRMLSWRNQGVFARLKVTPLPMPYVMLGMAGAQIVLSFVLGLLFLAASVFVFAMPFSAGGLLPSLVTLFMTAVAFVALGSCVATFASKPEVGSQLYTFVLLPMFFMGGGISTEVLPPIVSMVAPFLPTGLSISMLASVSKGGSGLVGVAAPMAGLLFYSVLLFGIASLRFRSVR